MKTRETQHIRRLSRPIVVSVLGAMLCALSLSMAIQAHELAVSAVTVNIGVRDDAKPFSYVDITRKSETILPGFSGYTIEVCRHVLKQMQTLPRYQNFTFKADPIRAMDRFSQLGEEGKLFMLCGPDSITSERLMDYRSSHALFLSGMTYAYLNPRSPNFPRGNHCDNIIGVVRGTTADTQGLKEIASQNLLMRFDKALDLEVINNAKRIAESRAALLRLTEKVLNEEQRKLGNLNQWTFQSTLFSEITGQSRLRSLKEALSQTDSIGLDEAINALEKQKNGLAGKIKDLMKNEHRRINAQAAKKIITDECPQGFTSMPVKKYERHDAGVEAFCKGEVLYYLADFDILKNKTQEIADCDIVMSRFTRSREVYGVYFPKQDFFDADPDPTSDSLIDVASFYANFNHFLLMAMQGELSAVETIFADEFGAQHKTEELARFFDSFKLDIQ